MPDVDSCEEAGEEEEEEASDAENFLGTLLVEEGADIHMEVRRLAETEEHSIAIEEEDTVEEKRRGYFFFEKRRGYF